MQTFWNLLNTIIMIQSQVKVRGWLHIPSSWSSVWKIIELPNYEFISQFIKFIVAPTAVTHDHPIICGNLSEFAWITFLIFYQKEFFTFHFSPGAVKLPNNTTLAFCCFMDVLNLLRTKILLNFILFIQFSMKVFPLRTWYLLFLLFCFDFDYTLLLSLCL